jgi:phospholipid/cholesterol/gamma-HCH transport system permease protein
MAALPGDENFGETPQLSLASRADGLQGITLTGDWTTLVLAQHINDLAPELTRHARIARASWDLSRLHRLDHTGALLLWQSWGQTFPAGALIPPDFREYFARLPGPVGDQPDNDRQLRGLRHAIVTLGRGALNRIEPLHYAIWLIGRLLLDVANVVRYPKRWPALEISAGIYHAGAQAMAILALVGFLIGVVLSYLVGDQLRRFGAEVFVVNFLGIACIRELGPLLAAVLVAGRSGSSMTAQLGVMRLNEEIDALTTMGIRFTQRLILPKIVSLAVAQPLAGLWTTAVALLGGMVSAHLALGIGYAYFLHAFSTVVPLANLWIGLLKGVVFGIIIAMVACYYGLRVKPNTESLGEGTTSSVVIAISSVLVADAVFAVVFSHVGL